MKIANSNALSAVRRHAERLGRPPERSFRNGFNRLALAWDGKRHEEASGPPSARRMPRTPALFAFHEPGTSKVSLRFVRACVAEEVRVSLPKDKEIMKKRLEQWLAQVPRP